MTIQRLISFAVGPNRKRAEPSTGSVRDPDLGILSLALGVFADEVYALLKGE